MRALGLGETATHLPWLTPRAASLVALARSPAASAWEEVRDDPGAVLLVLRFAPPNVPAAFPSLLLAPDILEGALRHLDHPSPGHVDWSRTEFQPVYRASLTYARLAGRLAVWTGRADPDSAWVAGLLAPLGWLAVSACAPEPAGALLRPEDPVQAWGLDPSGIARRLCRRWQLPNWLGAVIGNLGLTAALARDLGADADLFRVVQLAVALGQELAPGVRLVVGATAVENAAELGVASADLDDLRNEAADWLAKPVARRDWQPPESVPLLRELLALALEKRRLSEQPVLEQLEHDADRLHHALRTQRGSEDERLRTQKLGALAEFAAGAGHEINNPLAVISGQAQYLLTHEPDPNRQKALQTIVGQAQRIHRILSELMQFARPPQPQFQAVDAAQLAREAVATLQDQASQRRVQLRHEPQPPCFVRADPRLLRTALAALLRNAVEAAPADGWAGVRLDGQDAELLRLVVEDSGPGPAPAQKEHLFDPFYSGRQAGRGRGLGLPTAWQLARLHGGTVTFEEAPGGPTCFVLTVPRTADPGPTLPVAPAAEFLPPSPPANGTGHPVRLNGQAPASPDLPDVMSVS